MTVPTKLWPYESFVNIIFSGCKAMTKWLRHIYVTKGGKFFASLVDAAIMPIKVVPYRLNIMALSFSNPQITSDRLSSSGIIYKQAMNQTHANFKEQHLL